MMVDSWIELANSKFAGQRAQERHEQSRCVCRCMTMIGVRGIMIAVPIKPGMHLGSTLKYRVQVSMTNRTAACIVLDNTGRVVCSLVTA